MIRKTKYIVYVDKAVLDKPFDAADAVMTHFIKKELDPLERKKFFMAIRNAPTEKHAMKVIDEWVQIRDIAEFPFRKGKQAEGEQSGVDEEDTGEVSVDDKSDRESEPGTASD